jgi:hypothetical protein
VSLALVVVLVVDTTWQVELAERVVVETVAVQEPQ